MGLSYDPGARKWNLVYEKIDYRTDYPTNLPTNLPTDLPETTVTYVPVQKSRQVQKFRQVPRQQTYWDTQYVPGYGGQSGSYRSVQKTRTIYVSEPYWETEYYTENEARQAPNRENIAQNRQNAQTNRDNQAINESYQELNRKNTETNAANTVKNTAYDKTVSTANSTQGGDYVTQREVIRNLEGIDDRTKNTLENYFKAFYTTEILKPEDRWNSDLGAKTPLGDFKEKEANYYKSQNSSAAQAWQNAVDNDDLDITLRYVNEEAFYHWHYTNIGKPAGARAHEIEKLAAAEQYVEKTPTDADLEQVRNLQLNIDTVTDKEGNVKYTQFDRLLRTPEIASEWEKAKAGDPYWKSKAKEFFLDIDKPDEFATLFRLSDRPEDKEISFKYNINADYGITELEDALNQAAGEKATIEVKKFGALTQDVLRQTIDEMKKAKAREQQISMFSGLGTFKEIVDINKDLTNSILGDSGVGGILAFTSGGKAEESLEKSLRELSGVNNTVTYNWQQWFDESLKKRYEQDLELGLSTQEAEDNVKI